MILNFYKQVKRLGLFGLLTCFSFFLSAQEKKDSLIALELLSTARELIDERAFDMSLEKAKEASEQFAENQDWLNFREALNTISLIGYYSRNYDKVITILENGVKQVPISENLAWRKATADLAHAQMSMGAIFRAIENYETVLPEFIQSKDTLYLVSIYGSLSAGYMQTHDYAKAVKFAKNAVRLAEVGPNPVSHWRYLKFNAQAHFWNDELAQAERLFDVAQQLIDPQDGSFAVHKARLFLEQNKNEQALKTINTGLLQIDKSADKNGAFAARLLKAEILFDLGKRKKAINQLERLLSKTYELTNRRDLGKGYIVLALAHQELGNYEKSLTNYQLALTAFLPSFAVIDPKINPTLGELIPEALLIDIFSGKGSCYLEIAKLNQAGNALRLAEENFQLAIDFIDKIKLGFGETSSKLRLGEESYFVYERMLQTKLRLYEESQEERHRLAAFAIVQKANAFVLRELLNTDEALASAQIPQDRAEQWKALRSETLRYSLMLERSKGQKKDSLQQILFEQERRLADSKKQLLKDFPKFEELQANIRVAELSDIQKTLDPNSLLLKYFIGDKQLHTFAVTANKFYWEITELPEDFDKMIFQYRRSISDLDFVRDSLIQAEQLFLSTAHELYQILLAPVLEKVNDDKLNRLTIVSDGIINTIPFQALLMNAATNWLEPDNFLLSKFAINYAYFCKILVTGGADSKPSTDFVSFGLEFDKATLQYLQKLSKDSISNQVILDNLRSGTLTNLPFSDDEAKELAQMMKGKYWINENATKTNFLAEAIPANFIHMATHSILDEKNPNSSALVFTKQNDTLDNLLRQEEIYNLDMNAELIVLSACNTAFGRGHTGEGLNSLARAFNVSGIPSVTATFWNIADEASKKLMELYYANLKAGLPKDIALQKAQLAYLQNDEVSSPAFRLPPYWAAWVNIGDPSPITQKAAPPWWLIGTLGFVIAFLLYYLRS